MFDNEATEAATGLLGFLGGGIPPVFEEYGTEALRAGTVRTTGGEHDGVSYTSPDAGVYDLSTPQGRAAWKANAPEGVSRIVLEDGDAWLQRIADTVQNCASEWMERRGIDL